MTQSQRAIGLCGLPGAGKSLVAENLANRIGASTVSMGDAIRQRAPDGLASADLAKFAADWRSESPEEIPEVVADIAADHGEDVVVIDGVRSLTDYNVLSESFDRFLLLRVDSRFYIRLDRIRDRGREGEDTFDAVDLARRDENEFDNLGYRELKQSRNIDQVVSNNGSMARLEGELDWLVGHLENLGFIDPPAPA